jgi:hypothetical protein
MKRALMAAAMVLTAATGCESSSNDSVVASGPALTYGEKAAPSSDPARAPILSGAALSIRSSGAQSWWFVRTGVSFNPEALDAKGPDVVFAAPTGPEHFLIEKVAEGSSVGNAIESGDFVRLYNVEHDGWLKADTDNPLFVVSDVRIHTDENARFRIDKTAGSAGRQIRIGDPFRLRGIHGEPWLVAPVDGVVTVTREQEKATLFEFAAPP